MQVSRVIYARLINTGNYENERFECEVILDSGDLPAKAFEMAQVEVLTQVEKCLNNLDGSEDAEIPY